MWADVTGAICAGPGRAGDQGEGGIHQNPACSACPPGACLMVVRYSWRSYFWKESEFYVPLRDLEHDTLDAELRLDFAIL